MGNVIHYDYYCKLKEKLTNYIQYKEIISNLKKNLISNQILVDCGLINNIFKAKDFRKYAISVNNVESIVDKLIFLKFDSLATAWENNSGTIIVFTNTNSKVRWNRFKNFINTKKHGINKPKRRTMGTKTRKYSRRSMETRRKMY